MKVNIRQIAADLIERIEQGAYTNLVLNEVLNKHDLDPRDKALLTNIVKGSIQWKTKIDDFVSPYVKSGINKL
ncbi:MAG: hypothetical protein KDD56_08415, partial [Bdellovibrionales bacterium]|nr:hypothetical protein [Bdellovibrionales bacterium]